MKANLGSFAKSLRSHKKTILMITAASVATLVVSSLISVWLSKNQNLTFPTVGNIRFEGVEGYWDKNLTNKTGPETPFDWGLIWPGATKNLTLYLRSLSNVDINFTLTETDWTFYNSSTLTPDTIVAGPSNVTPHMWLSWDYDNSTVHPGEIRQVTLTLHVGSSPDFIKFLIDDDVKKFSVDIHISTSG